MSSNYLRLVITTFYPIILSYMLDHIETILHHPFISSTGITHITLKLQMFKYLGSVYPEGPERRKKGRVRQRKQVSPGLAYLPRDRGEQCVERGMTDQLVILRVTRIYISFFRRHSEMQIDVLDSTFAPSHYPNHKVNRSREWPHTPLPPPSLISPCK